MTEPKRDGSSWARHECPACKGDPESVEVYAHPLADEPTKPADCKACGARNPLAHGSRYTR